MSVEQSILSDTPNVSQETNNPVLPVLLAQSLPSDTGSVNQELSRSYNLAYLPSPSHDATMDYYPTGTSDPGHYDTIARYTQGITPASSDAGQSVRNTYPQHLIDPQWIGGHHQYSSFLRSGSWPPQHIGDSAPALVSPLPSDPVSVGGRKQIVVPQRLYVPHHRQNYFDQFIPENPITFPHRHQGDGIALNEVLSENFDHLVGRDDGMFANYNGPAINLRLEWPGYKSWTRQIKSRDWRRQPQPITKAKLANEVAKRVRKFIQDNVDEPMTPGTERWQVGPGFIQVEDLVLVRLVQVSKGSWQAEFRVFE